MPTQNIQSNSKETLPISTRFTKLAFSETGYTNKQDDSCVDPTPLTKEHCETSTKANLTSDDGSNTTQDKTSHSAEGEDNVR